VHEHIQWHRKALMERFDLMYQVFLYVETPWKIAAPINSTGMGTIEMKKMVPTFSAFFATARATGVFIGRVSC